MKGGREFNDINKANQLNKMYCHQDYPVKYKIITKMNITDIPTIPKRIYPQNNIIKAEFIPNPNLHNDYYMNQHLKQWNADIKTVEVIDVMSRINVGVNHGIGLNAKLLKPVINEIATIITWFLNICLHNGHCPNLYKLRQIIPTCKPNKNPHVDDEYRQISLYGVMRKILECIINDRTITYIVKTDLISKYSMAALKGKSGLDAIAILISNIYKRFSKKIGTFAIYLDIQHCYPSQHFDITINRLKNYYGLKGPMF
ncbi:MAG: hypothetical protein GY739_17840, partial [Mesoflavibacter sp.]|nr:hypothetical protein [Mesoflavibacter sp.]